MSSLSPIALMLRPIDHGWAVVSTDGRVLARFAGPGARQRAQRFIERMR
jgi:hypothetical protein